MRLDLIVGARGALIKAAPVVEALRARLSQDAVCLIATMRPPEDPALEVFFRRTGIPRPDVNLGVPGGTNTQETAAVMTALEGRFRSSPPSAVVVFGEENAALACALSASRLQIPVAHVEAGLRSFDRSAADEVNRVVTDMLSRWLFVSERSAENNLLNEGYAHETIHFAGSTRIDSVLKHRPLARDLGVATALGLREREYVAVVLYRAANIEKEPQLRSISYALQSLADHHDVVVQADARTVKRLKDHDLWDDMDRNGRMRVIKPLGYLESLGLLDTAGAVLTDYGVVQEEAAVLGVPCVTLLHTTERQATLQHGANRLAGNDPHLAVRYLRDALRGRDRVRPVPDGCDGQAAARIADVLALEFGRELPAAASAAPEGVARASGSERPAEVSRDR